MKRIWYASLILSFLIVFGNYTTGNEVSHGNIRIAGYVANNNEIIFIKGSLQDRDSIYFIADIEDSEGRIIPTLMMFEDNMHLVPLASYKVTLQDYYSYSNLIARYGDGFLIAGELLPKKDSDFMGGFWISFVDKNFNPVWTRAYLTRFPSSVVKIIHDNSTGKLLLIGDGCFYSGSDGFFAVFNPDTLEIERIIGIGGINADGIFNVLMPDDKTYILVGSSWSLGDSQEKLLFIKLDRNFKLVSSRAYTILRSGTPVPRLELSEFHVTYWEGKINVSGTFRIENFTKERIILTKAGLWWAEFDDDLNLLEYHFRTTIINSSPIDLGSINNLVKMKKLKVLNGTLIVADVNLEYPMVMVGRLEKNRIVGELIGTPYPAGVYLYLTYPQTTVLRRNSLTVFLYANRFSDGNFYVYNRSIVSIDIPYSELNNLSVLRDSYLYGGNITIRLHPWNVSVKEIHDAISSGIRIVDVQFKQFNMKLSRVRTIPKVTILRDPRPVGYLNLTVYEPFMRIMSLEIFLDGKKIKPNRWYSLPAGMHTLTVKKPGFRPYSTEIEIRPNTAHYRYLDDEIGFLNITVEPPDANFTIACPREYGEVSYNLSHTNGSAKMILPVSWCNMTIQRKGYQTYSRKVIITAGQVVRQRVVLKPKPAYLLVDSNPRAEIWINGSSMGMTPQNISLLHGRYRVTLSTPGYKNYSINVTLAPGDYRVLNVTLAQVQTTSNETTNRSTSTGDETPLSSTSVTASTSPKPSRTKVGGPVCGPATVVLLTMLALIRRGRA